MSGRPDTEAGDDGDPEPLGGDPEDLGDGPAGMLAIDDGDDGMGAVAHDPDRRLRGVQLQPPVGQDDVAERPGGSPVSGRLPIAARGGGISNHSRCTSRKARTASATWR